jgi:hypothetical protein
VAKKRDFLMELDCVEGALVEARRLYLQGATPQQILDEMKVDKKADSWIIAVAHMAGWWYRERNKDKGNA